MSIQQKAIEYIKNGLSIHLLKPLEKRPMNNGWSKALFLGVDEFNNEISNTPTANIGVRLGEMTKIGTRYLYVLDLDISSLEPEQIKEAYKNLHNIYKDYDKLPMVKSSTLNSRHFYFLSKILLKNKKICSSDTKVTVIINGEEKVKNAWEIDLCSTGKQVVLPPSVFNGKTYKWERDLLEYLNDDSKKALMIIDDMSLISIDFENDPQNVILNTPEPRKFKITEIEKILNRLPKNFYDNYDDWLKVGMALHFEFDDTDDEQIQRYI